MNDQSVGLRLYHGMAGAALNALWAARPPGPGRLHRAQATIKGNAIPASKSDDGSGTDMAVNACKPPSAVS